MRTSTNEEPRVTYLINIAINKQKFNLISEAQNS